MFGRLPRSTSILIQDSCKIKRRGTFLFNLYAVCTGKYYHSARVHGGVRYGSSRFSADRSPAVEEQQQQQEEEEEAEAAEAEALV